MAETTTDGVSPPAAFDDRIKRMNSGVERDPFFSLLALFFSLSLLYAPFFSFSFLMLIKKIKQQQEEKIGVITSTFSQSFYDDLSIGILHENLTNFCRKR